MSVQWYPGHIARARKEIKENLKNVDIVIEVIDARCPMSSINFLSTEIKNKKHLVVINKYDLADEEKVKNFISILKNEAQKNLYDNNTNNNINLPEVICLDSRNNNIKKIVDKKIDILCKQIVEKNERKGIKNVLLKAMVVGMPNVGKSTFINSYVKKKVNNVANTPGVTKQLQWAKISDKILLLDTPGVTVPKFKNDLVGENLVLIGSINDDIVEKQDLVYNFIDRIKQVYFDLLKNRYKLVDTTKDAQTIDIMNEIAIRNACVKKGNNIDYEKVSNLIIIEFRKGLIGKISLE